MYEASAKRSFGRLAGKGQERDLPSCLFELEVKVLHGHFYGNFTGNLAHAQSVCTRPFSRGEGPGDEASIIQQPIANKTFIVF